MHTTNGDILEHCELFRPLIALHASDNAQNSAKKNGFLDFAQLLLPYTMVQIDIREPIGQTFQHNLRIDIRDLRHSGFLLSHTVLPFVLQESILAGPIGNENVQSQQSILSDIFYHAFSHWQEPAEHEYLRAYLACIFVASTMDGDPLKELADLEVQQHREQHNDQQNSVKRISPAYCVPPKWFFPNILKFYILVHDNSLQHSNPSRSKEFFAAICNRYGQNLCHFIELNSANPANPADEGMPDGNVSIKNECPNPATDPWQPILRRNFRGLHSGLELAKRNLLSPSKTATKHPSESQNNLAALVDGQHPSLSLPPVSSAPSLSLQQHEHNIPSPLFTTTAPFNPVPTNLNYHQQPPPIHFNVGQNQPITDNFTTPSPLTYAQIAGGSSPVENNASDTFTQLEEIETNQLYLADNPLCHGKWLSVEDRHRLRELIETFVRNALVPFVEKQLAEQSEIVMKRGNLAKNTFTSMRKWLQSATTNASTITAQQQQKNQVAAISYPAESAECQSRRLADLAFLFGLYQYSNQIYQSLKRDFANDQAWLYHAGCLEMASTSAFLSQWQQHLDQINSNPSLKTSALAMLRKQYPQRYMDNAIHFYANVCGQPLLALRALMNGVYILTHLEQFTEAAQQLIRFNTSSDLAYSDLVDGILLEHAARLFQLTRNRERKAFFYLATAATRVKKFASLNQQLTPQSLQSCKKISRRFYEEVLNSNSFTGKRWTWAEHYLLYQYITCV